MYNIIGKIVSRHIIVKKQCFWRLSRGKRMTRSESSLDCNRSVGGVGQWRMPRKPKEKALRLETSRGTFLNMNILEMYHSFRCFPEVRGYWDNGAIWGNQRTLPRAKFWRLRRCIRKGVGRIFEAEIAWAGIWAARSCWVLLDLGWKMMLIQ